MRNDGLSRAEDTKPTAKWDATYCNEVHLKFSFY